MNKYFLIISLVLTASISSMAQLTVNFTQLNMGCSGGECEGQIRAIVSGGIPPYRYDWGNASVMPNDSSVAINLCEGLYHMSIYDSSGDRLDTSIIVKVYPAPQIELTIEPEDPWYIQNPTGTFSFTNLSVENITVEGWKWDFGDGTTSFDSSPIHTYTEIGNYDLIFTANYQAKCDTNLYFSLGIKTVRLLIPNIITPNNDGINDVFIITQDTRNSTSQHLKSASTFPKINDFYITNELVIFNRWGQKVFEQQNYQNDWNGEKLKDGVYFYVLKCHGEFEDDVFKGSLTIMGSDR